MLIWTALISLSDFFVIYVCNGLTGDTETDKGGKEGGSGGEKRRETKIVVTDVFKGKKQINPRTPLRVAALEHPNYPILMDSCTDLEGGLARGTLGNGNLLNCGGLSPAGCYPFSSSTLQSFLTR